MLLLSFVIYYCKVESTLHWKATELSEIKKTVLDFQIDLFSKTIDDFLTFFIYLGYNFFYSMTYGQS